MQLDGPIVTMLVACLGGVVWLVRLEGRVNVHDALLKRCCEDLLYIRDRLDHFIDETPEDP